MSPKKIHPEIRYLTHRQNIRDIYTISQAITFNTVSGLFSANDINPPNTPVYLRFCKINRDTIKIICPRFEKISDNQQYFTHFIPYIAFASTDFHFYLVIPEDRHCVNIIDAIRNGNFIVSEKNLRDAFKTIIETMNKMHELDIVHGQLNPRKVFVKNGQGYIYDVCMGIESREDLIVENYNFLSPEILNGESQSLESDIWALGAIIYYLITAHMMFLGSTFEEFIKNVAMCEINFDEPVWNMVSEQLKDLIKSMLNRDKALRPTISDIANSDWVQNRCSVKSDNLISDLSNFERDREFRYCVYKLMSTLANAKTRKAVEEWNEVLNQNYEEVLDFGTLLFCLLGESHPLCEEFCDYWEEPIDYKKFLLCTMGLRALVIQERAAILFYQLSRNKVWLEEEDIARLLENTGNSEYIHDRRQFKLLIKHHQQNSIRADYRLYFPEFLALHNTLELNPSEEFAMGRFFDLTR